MKSKLQALARHRCRVLLANFVTNDATHRGAGACAQQTTTAQNVACDAAYDGTGGGAFLLLRHPGATGQARHRQQQDGRQISRKSFKLVHDKFLQIDNRKQVMVRNLRSHGRDLIVRVVGETLRASAHIPRHLFTSNQSDGSICVPQRTDGRPLNRDHQASPD